MIYRREIDGMRALAVIPVLFFHAGFSWFDGGFIGVDIFFVISGYLITYIIISQLSENKFTISRFYERRAKRILPPLFLMMFACYPFCYFLMAPYEIKDFGESLLATSFFSSNFLFAAESGYFQGPSEFKPLLHTWSLAVEEQFYVFYPLLLILVWKTSKKFLLPILLCLLFISFLLGGLLSPIYPNYSFYLLPTRAWELFSGSLISVYLFLNHNSNIPPHKSFSNFLSLMGFLMIVFSISYVDSTTIFPGLITLLPVLGTCLLILFTTENTLLYKFFSNKILVWFGLISYSLYLWHQPILVFGRIYFEDQFDKSIAFILILISVFIAFLSWKYFENPTRKSIVSKKTTFIIVIIFISFFSMTHLYIQKENGFLTKLENQNVQFSKTINEFSKYTTENQTKIQKIPFAENGKMNVLIIGDSYSQDFINILYESKYLEKYNYSSFFIPKRCKNLNISNENLSKIIDDSDKTKCSISSDNYFSDELKRLMNDSQIIILASSWQEEDMSYIHDSIINTTKQSNSLVYIVSTRSFNHELYNYGLRKLSKLSTEDIKNQKFSLPTEKILINQHLNNFNLIDLTKIYCENNVCKISDSDGNLLSYDGSHLTYEGAVYFANRLENLSVEIFSDI